MKGLSIIFALSILVGYGCSTRHAQGTIYPGLVKKDGLYFKAGEGRPYSGIIHAYYGAGEKKFTATKFEKGRMIHSLRYYPTGLKYSSVKFDTAGRPVEMTYFYPSGHPRVQVKGGKVRTWDESGRLRTETLSIPDSASVAALPDTLASR